MARKPLVIDTSQGDPRFYAALARMAEVYAARNHDYAGEALGGRGPHWMFEFASGLRDRSAYDAAVTELLIKVGRFVNLLNMAERGIAYRSTNDPLIDTIIVDLPNYAVIAGLLIEDWLATAEEADGDEATDDASA